MENDAVLTLSGETFSSRLILGTGKYASGQILADVCQAAGAKIATLAVKRVDVRDHGDDIVAPLRRAGIRLMPNTSGARDAREAVYAAKLAREALGTDWVKVEVHPDVRYLLPDPVETFKACEELCRLGFKVFPYVQPDPVLCRRLEELGVQAVMPLGSPIGSGRGIENRQMLGIIIAQAKVPVIVDAGIGAPSDVALALEMGASACMVNTAIAAAADPLKMATAFRLAAEAGETGRAAGLITGSASARPSSPMESFLKEAMA